MVSDHCESITAIEVPENYVCIMHMGTNVGPNSCTHLQVSLFLMDIMYKQGYIFFTTCELKGQYFSEKIFYLSENHCLFTQTR